MTEPYLPYLPGLLAVRGPAQLHTPGRLPRWPLLVMFGAMPVLWLAGAFYVAWPLLGTLLVVLLLAERQRVELPAGTGFWLVFCALVALSATRLAGGQLVVAGLRFAFYLTAL